MTALVMRSQRLPANGNAGESYRLATSKKAQRRSAQGQSQNPKTPSEGDLANEL